MRRVFFLLVVISAILFPLTISAAPARIPFADEIVPDQIEERWRHYGSSATFIRTRAGKEEVLHEAQYYGDHNGFFLEIHKYAGGLVFKRLGHADGRYTIAIRMNGMWFTANANWPLVQSEYDSDGYLTKITFRPFIRRVYLSEELVAERVVIIPRAWFVEPQNP